MSNRERSGGVAATIDHDPRFRLERRCRHPFYLLQTVNEANVRRAGFARPPEDANVGLIGFRETRSVLKQYYQTGGSTSIKNILRAMLYVGSMPTERGSLQGLPITEVKYDENYKFGVKLVAIVGDPGDRLLAERQRYFDKFSEAVGIQITPEEYVPDLMLGRNRHHQGDRKFLHMVADELVGQAIDLERVVSVPHPDELAWNN